MGVALQPSFQFVPRKTRSRQQQVASRATADASQRVRPAVILPGLGNNTRDYALLASALNERGISTVVAEVSRFDWLRNAAGLLDGNYWKGTLRPRPVLDWYFLRMQKAVEAARTHGHKISLIGHSAGGWLARLYMCDYASPDDVELLLTLGTPHLPPPKGVPGVFDQTRGLLNYVEQTSPGAFHSPDVKYVCIASRYIKGAPVQSSKLVTPTGVGTLGNIEELDGEEGGTRTFQGRLIGQGYKQVCGRADVWGDGVVPEMSSHLNGALNLTLEGVYHSPVGSTVERPWYGSPEVLESWICHLSS